MTSTSFTDHDYQNKSGRATWRSHRINAPVIPEIEQLSTRNILCIYGTEESDSTGSELTVGLARARILWCPIIDSLQGKGPIQKAPYGLLTQH